MGFFLYIYIMDLTQFQDLSVEQINAMMLKLYIKNFKEGNFDFIVEGYAKNKAGDWEIGDKVIHEKQKKALEILTGNEYHHFLYGGAAGGAKTWTGVCWLVFTCLAYPNIKAFAARNELKSLLDSVYETFRKVKRTYGISDDLFKFNAQRNYIRFTNGSQINLIEVAYKPSDPMYEDVGSTEYTIGWLEEVGEIHHQAYLKLTTRIGRHLNAETGLVKKLYMTCNPKQNWAKINFYDKHNNGKLYEENKIPLPNGELPSQKVYLNCLVTENPFIEQESINELMTKAREDKSTYERLFKGNRDYEDNPNQLAEQEMIEQVFDNDHVEEGYSYLTADVARYGSDKAVIIAWKGWVVKEIMTYDFSSTQDIVGAILYLRKKYRIPRSRCIADGDGVGGGVIDYAGIKEFRNNGKTIKINREDPNYRNLQVQCLYLLAEKINEGGLYIEANGGVKGDKNYIQHIKQELAQIQSIPNQRDATKLDCKRKPDIQRDINRSPDYRDSLLMRVWFDLKPLRQKLVVKWS